MDLQWFPQVRWRRRCWGWLVVGRLAFTALTPHARQPRAKATQLHRTGSSLGISLAPHRDTISAQRLTPTARLPTPVLNPRSRTDIFVCLEQGKAEQPRRETEKHSDDAISLLVYPLLTWIYLCCAAILKICQPTSNFQSPLTQDYISYGSLRGVVQAFFTVKVHTCI